MGRFCPLLLTTILMTLSRGQNWDQCLEATKRQNILLSLLANPTAKLSEVGLDCLRRW